MRMNLGEPFFVSVQKTWRTHVFVVSAFSSRFRHEFLFKRSFIFLPWSSLVTFAGSPDHLLEGDVLMPRKRTAMKCYSKKYSCLWTKSANGKVEIPYVVSDEYGTRRASLFRVLRFMDGRIARY